MAVAAARARGGRFSSGGVAALGRVAGNARSATLVAAGELGTARDEAAWHDQIHSSFNRGCERRIRGDVAARSISGSRIHVGMRQQRETEPGLSLVKIWESKMRGNADPLSGVMKKTGVL